MAYNQTGVFFVGAQPPPGPTEFPREFKRGIIGRFESRFVIIVAEIGRAHV